MSYGTEQIRGTVELTREPRRRRAWMRELAEMFVISAVVSYVYRAWIAPCPLSPLPTIIEAILR